MTSIPTIEQWLSAAQKTIQSNSPELDAELLLCHHLQKSRAYLRAFNDEALSVAVLDKLNADMEKLSTGYPIAYLLGYKDFWDMRLIVSEATLIPRADTETLVEIAEQRFPTDSAIDVIDLGTGSGAIAIALSRIFPQSTITATDMSEAALHIAKANAERWAIAPVECVKNDWLDGIAPTSMDMIVSNPPYIEEADGHLADLIHEPITALTASDKGLADIKIIISQAQTVLKPNGWLLLEHGFNQGRAVRGLFNINWDNIKTYPDLGGNDRVTIAQKINESLM